MEHSEKDIDTLYKDNVDALYLYARNLGYDKQLAIDAIHDVFCKIFTSNKQLRDISNIKSYLFKALRNRLLDMSKSHHDFVDIDTVTANDMHFALEVTIEDKLINAEEQTKLEKRINRMLSILTDRERELIYLRFMQGCEYEEIAENLQITLPACYNFMSKVMNKLRKQDPAAFVLFMIFMNQNINKG